MFKYGYNMSNKKTKKDSKVVVAVSYKRVQTAEGKKRAFLRDARASKSKAA